MEELFCFKPWNLIERRARWAELNAATCPQDGPFAARLWRGDSRNSVEAAGWWCRWTYGALPSWLFFCLFFEMEQLYHYVSKCFEINFLYWTPQLLLILSNHRSVLRYFFFITVLGKIKSVQSIFWTYSMGRFGQPVAICRLCLTQLLCGVKARTSKSRLSSRKPRRWPSRRAMEEFCVTTSWLNLQLYDLTWCFSRGSVIWVIWAKLLAQLYILLASHC